MDTATVSVVTRIRSLAGCVVLLAVIVAATMGPAPTAVAQQHGLQHAKPNYLFETLFDVRDGATDAFDRYWAALKELAEDGADAPRRFVEGQANGTGRRVTLPVARLAEYRVDRRNEAVLRTSLGEDAAGVLIRQFNEAQISRTSYLRRFRDDLSVRRDRHARTAATAVTFVMVTPGREPAFERAWQRGAEAFAKTDAAFVATVARTLVGGGPQFVITRPALERGPRTALGAEDLVAAVREAFGNAAALEVAEMFEASGATWRTELYRNLGYDTMGVTSSH